MNEYRIFYAGTEREVGHHVAPLSALGPVDIVAPEAVDAHARTGDLVIFFSEHFHRFRNAWAALKRKGCLTLYALDGILEWRNAWENSEEEPACPWTMRPVLSDKVACIGPLQQYFLDAWGNGAKTELVGLPRLDSLTREYRAATRTASGESGVRLAGTRFRLLVTTAKWPAYTEQQRDQIVASLRDLHAWLLRHGDAQGRAIEVTWRLTGGIAESLGLDPVSVDEGKRSISEALDEADAVITTPSTVLLESMLRSRPTALLDYTNSPEYVATAWRATAREQIGPVVEQLANPASSRLAHQRHLLPLALQISEPAANRLWDLCQRMIRQAHDCRANSEKVAFPVQMLSAPATAPPCDLSGVWGHTQANTDGLDRCANADADGAAALESVLQENRRQLALLQRRADLLESELKRAAEGFDRIASHPILAPLLKVRQTALRFGKHVNSVLSRSDTDDVDILDNAAPATGQAAESRSEGTEGGGL